MFAIWW